MTYRLSPFIGKKRLLLNKNIPHIIVTAYHRLSNTGARK
jgi:hypothetical protein